METKVYNKTVASIESQLNNGGVPHYKVTEKSIGTFFYCLKFNPSQSCTNEGIRFESVRDFIIFDPSLEVVISEHCNRAGMFKITIYR